MKHLAALNPFFWKYRSRLLLGILFIILTNYFRILAPQLTGYVVNVAVNTAGNANAAGQQHKKEYDFVVQKIISQLETSSLSQQLLWCCITLLLLALVSGIFMFLMRQTIIVMSRLIEYS